MEQWDIDKPLGHCFGTGKEIEAGQEYFGALVETNQGLQRQDFSIEYFNNEKPDVFCYWKTKLPYPDQKKSIFIDEEMLMAFFGRLADETQQERINFRFVLALILMRKRRLKYDSSRMQGDNEIWLLRQPGDKPAEKRIDVVNPCLDEDQIQQLSSQIGQILQADL